MIVLMMALMFIQSQEHLPDLDADESPENWGWVWLIRPQPLAVDQMSPGSDDSDDHEPSWIREDVADEIRILYELSDDLLRIDLVTPPDMEMGPQGHNFRVVVLHPDDQRSMVTRAAAFPTHDDDGRRRMRIMFLIRGADLGSPQTRCGVEMMTPEGRRVASDRAIQRARAAGWEIAPLFEIGRQVSFEWTCADGRRIRSSDLRGRVILIDCWATWCTPCMQKMNDLRKLYARYHGQGFEIIGLNFDNDHAKARDAIATQQLNWPHVLLPADPQRRELWEIAMSTTLLPRLILLDPMGVVRYDIPPAKLAKKLNNLMREPGPRTWPLNPAPSLQAVMVTDP